MMKKISFIASTVIAISLASPVQAAEFKSVAIIDTAFTASEFGDKVVEEVCVTAGGGCNNLTGFDIGRGSSGAKIAVRAKDLEDWNHGNFMARTIVGENPDVRLVLIRNAKIYGSAILPGTEKDLAVALSWVQQNADKHNIIAVSVSRGSHKYVSANKQVSSLLGNIKIYQGMVDRLKNAKANPKLIAPLEAKLNEFKSQLDALGPIACPVDNNLKQKIIDLQNINVATIIATGNDADKTYVDYPACIDEAVAVTAHNGSEIVYVANLSSNTDFAAYGTTTSEATARLAGIWSRVYNGSYNSTYGLLNSSGTKHHQTTIVP